MQYIADLHIHSPYSRATSKAGTLAGLFAWARVKGLNLIGTGDFTHPGWFKHLKDNLEPAEPGLYRLKDEQVAPALPGLMPKPIPVRFLLTAEISNIYKRHGQVRKVHNLLIAPDFAAVERLNAKLAAIGNVESDGRPILGLDSRNLLEILLECTPDGFLVPAHIWTPWFSLFGSKSGFDSIEECYGDLAGQVFALETGLSSDPAMNRLVSGLDRFALISNSDCHSPAKLGREANLFDTEFSYFGLRNALRDRAGGGFLGTIEFFPEEGKYHLDGHRKCNICLEPGETRGVAGICPVCGRPLTIGVAHRVMELADRATPVYPEGSGCFKSLIPLPEVLSELLRTGPASKAVLAEYSKAIALFGSEFTLLLDTPVDEIKERYSPLLALAIDRMRNGQVHKNPGYDGEFGVIKVFEEGELTRLAGQLSLFVPPARKKIKAARLTSATPLVRSGKSNLDPPPTDQTPNPEQEEAIRLDAPAILVTAGPGTGKTHTLIRRLCRLLKSQAAEAAQCFAITFTNRAANELRTRLKTELGEQGEAVFAGTFHRFCLDWLQTRDTERTVLLNDDRLMMLKRILPGRTATAYREIGQDIADYLAQLAATTSPPTPGEPVRHYLAELDRRQALDVDAIIPYFVRKLRDDPDFRDRVASQVGYLFVDEFQDVNQTQFELVNLLSEHSKVFAIGDPDQAIYGFRGSDSRFFHEFQNRPATTTITLRRNYRSAGNILQAAGAVIRHNPNPDRQELITRLKAPGLIEYHPQPTPAAEAEAIVRRIEELMAGISHFSMNSGRGGETGETGIGFRDIAILTRLNRQAPEITGALDRRGLPCQQVGATPFFMQEAVSPLYYWLQCASGRATTGEYLALLARAPGIGSQTLAKLEALPPGRLNFFAAAAALNLATAPAARLRELQDKLDAVQQNCLKNSLVAGIEEAIDYLQLAIPAPDRQRFLELAGLFGRDPAALALHLEQNAVATIYDPRAEAVGLMTLHAAKGLEFPLVFITGLEEDILPYAHHGDDRDLAEERRLFYVGMTRASRYLILTSSATRVLAGAPRPMSPSRFLAEIPKDLLKTVKPVRPARRKPTASQLKLF